MSGFKVGDRVRFRTLSTERPDDIALGDIGIVITTSSYGDGPDRQAIVRFPRRCDRQAIMTPQIPLSQFELADH